MREMRGTEDHRRVAGTPSLLMLAGASVPCALLALLICAFELQANPASRSSSSGRGAQGIPEASTALPVRAALVSREAPLPEATSHSAATSQTGTLRSAVERTTLLGRADSTAGPASVTASLDGRMLAADGTGIEDLPITLAPRGATSAGVLRTTTGLDGVFHFPEVPVGEVRILVGDADEPFVEPWTVQVETPRTLLEDLSLPRLGSLEVIVRDESGFAVAGAEVRCTGNPRGSSRAITDADGRAVFRALPPTEGRVLASHSELGRGNRVFVVGSGPAARVELTLLSSRGSPRRDSRSG